MIDDAQRRLREAAAKASHVHLTYNLRIIALFYAIPAKTIYHHKLSFLYNNFI